MFKGAKWMSEKNRFKAEFRVQFQATQVPQTGWGSLLVALVPSETGKPSAKTDKVQVRSGACLWENPVYETVKLSREAKTGKFEEKAYQFIVSNGSSKGGILGQAAVDFAEYADAVKPCYVSLSLGPSNSTILHVTIERLHTDGDIRDDEKRRTATRSPHSKSLRHHMSDVDTDGSSKTSYSTTNSCASKDVSVGNGTVQFSPSIMNTVPRTAECDNKGFRNSDTISASSSSDSSLGNDFTHEYKFKPNVHKDAISFLSPLSSHARSPQLLDNGYNSMADQKECEDSNIGWTPSWTSKESRQDSTNTSEQVNLHEKLQAAEIEIAKLKNEIIAMGRQAELSDIEVQTLRKQIVKERKKVQEFSKEMCSLREERDALRQEHEQLKASRANDGITVVDKTLDNCNEGISIIEEVKQELSYERELNADLHLQLQKTQEANSELILAVQDLEDLLGQKEREISHVSHSSRGSMRVTDESCQELLKMADVLRKNQVHSYQDPKNIKHDGDQEQLALEVLLKEHDNADNASTLEQQILQLQNELDECKKDRDNIEMQMEQLALDYEILKQENHDMAFKLDQSEIQEQLKMQYESSVSLAVINDLEAHVEDMEKEFIKQEETFETELAALTHAKVEQEQRATRAEEMLRKTRQSNVDMADRLQEELKILFAQISATFGTNEKLTMQAVAEANNLRIQKSHLEELLKKSSKELRLVKDHYEKQLNELSTQVDSKINGISQLLSEVEYLSTELKAQKKVAEVAINSLSNEILTLKADIQRLITENNGLFTMVEEKEKVLLELQEMKARMHEKDLMLEREDAKRKALNSQVLLAKEEAGKSLEELHDMRLLLVDKEQMIGMLHSELKTVTLEYSELKQTLFEHELERENLQKEVFQLRGDLKDKEDTITAIEKKVTDNASRVIALEGNVNADTNNNKSFSAQQFIKDVPELQEKIRLLECTPTNDGAVVGQEEIKIKEATLEISTNKFAEKERDLYSRIEELQEATTMSQSWNMPNSSDGNVWGTVFGSQHQKGLDMDKDVSVNLKETTAGSEESQDQDRRLPGNSSDDESRISKRMDILSGMLDQVDNEQGSLTSIIINPSDEQNACCPCTSAQDDVIKLIAEISQLKKKNTSMEDELKEMQERYSEISLKFAEVEGERQQLIMTVRNLKNAKRI